MGDIIDVANALLGPIRPTGMVVVGITVNDYRQGIEVDDPLRVFIDSEPKVYLTITGSREQLFEAGILVLAHGERWRAWPTEREFLKTWWGERIELECKIDQICAWDCRRTILDVLVLSGAITEGQASYVLSLKKLGSEHGCGDPTQEEGSGNGSVKVAFWQG